MTDSTIPAGPPTVKLGKLVPIVTVLAVVLAAVALFVLLILPNMLRGPLSGETSHDFGDITVGVPVTYTFRLQNTSRLPVVIERDRANCKCLTYTLSTTFIEPGQTLEVAATLNIDVPAEKSLDVMLELEGLGVKRLTVSGNAHASPGDGASEPPSDAPSATPAGG